MAFAFAPPLVDQAPQCREDAGEPMNFVKDDQPILVLREIKFRLGQLCTVGRQLQVKIERLLARFLG